MRLTAFILLSACLTASATGHSQKVSISERNASLEKVFSIIEKQTGYAFFYNVALVQKAKRVNIDVENAMLEDVLELVFRDQSLVYNIVDKNIVVKEKSTAVFQPTVTTNEPPLPIDVKGRVVNEKGEPVVATVQVKGSATKATSTDTNGYFELKGVDENATLMISGVSIETFEVSVNGRSELSLNAKMKVTLMGDVTVEVNTGYQRIPRERATGSFAFIDKELLNRRVSTNILERFEGMVSGLAYGKPRPGATTPDISIRGRSTIFANPNPLIVLDNFPYDGDISNINPQDVSSVTILKDAAAAAIWGSRAGNGVIVITTNKGKLNQKPTVSFNSNITIGEKPDQYYFEQLTTKQFIEVEQFLFDNGKYNQAIDNGFENISSAVEIMLQRRNNLISEDRKQQMLDSIASHDNRRDLDRYFYRKDLRQQYQLNIAGGGRHNKYYFSAGYDRNLPSAAGTAENRFTLRANNSYYLLNDKLELNSKILFSTSNAESSGRLYTSNYPYEKIADDNGNPLAVTDSYLRPGFVDTAGAGLLLDWHYRPLEELRNGYESRYSTITDYRIDFGIDYEIIAGLKLQLNYAYEKGIQEQVETQGRNSYTTRNAINQISQIDWSTRTVIRPIPVGDVVSNINTAFFAHYGRGQAEYQNSFNNKHDINAIAGYEVKDFQSSLRSFRLYGYDKETEVSQNGNMNFRDYYPYYYGYNAARLDPGITSFTNSDRFLSFFANASYSYDRKYTLSVSARKDQSNLFGVNSNQKGVPLWSAGFLWDISRETFFTPSFLQYLKLRVTFGYNGNVDKTTSAYLTATTNEGYINILGRQYLLIQNPPNPTLRWEKVKNWNAGVDFEFQNNRVSGSLEYWIKEGIDLIGGSPLAPQTGVTVFRGNSANMRTRGVDLVINTKNIVSGFQWQTMFLINYNSDKITAYKVKAVTNHDIVFRNVGNPLEGYSYYTLFSYRWLGLDSAGHPIGSLDGKPSSDYSAIANALDRSSLMAKGTFSPKIYGSILNTFSWRRLQLSFNVIYKLDYYFRRPSLNYNALLSARGVASYQQPEFSRRWQGPGDELITDVPSLLYPDNFFRSSIYNYSELTVEKADHVRLQDIRLGYNFIGKSSGKKLFNNVSIYAYINNLGVIWKASSYHIDPEYVQQVPAARTYTIGFTANF